jgi:alpha/beta superfamily hydrolase
VQSTLLISPPSSLFGITTLLSSKTFSRALRQAGDVTIIHGTRDQFTNTSTFEALGEVNQVQSWAVDGADHFFRDERSTNKLVELIERWLMGHES